MVKPALGLSKSFPVPVSIMVNFASKWQRNDSSTSSRSPGNIGNRLRGGSNEPLRKKIEEAMRHIQIQIARLDQTTGKLKERDASIFSRVIVSVQNNENLRANMLANELVEIRKMSGIVTQAKLALEQLVLSE